MERLHLTIAISAGLLLTSCTEPPRPEAAETLRRSTAPTTNTVG